MLICLVESGEPEVLRALDEHDGTQLIDEQKKLFACPHCGLLFTRNNIIKHIQCLALDAKPPIQECLSGKLRYLAKLLESGDDLPSKNHLDAIAVLNMKITDMPVGEKDKLRSRFPYFKRFQKALSENAPATLPRDKKLTYQLA